MRGVAKVQDEGTARFVLCGQSPVRFCAVVLSVSLSGPASDWGQVAIAEPTTAPASAVNSGPKPEAELTIEGQQSTGAPPDQPGPGDRPLRRSGFRFPQRFRPGSAQGSAPQLVFQPPV